MAFVARLIFLFAGLVFAASLAVALVLMLALWCLQAGWASLTGRPVSRFIVRLHPRSGFERMYRRSGAVARRSRNDRAPHPPADADVTDVEPRPPAS